MGKIRITQKEDKTEKLYHICGKTFGYMDMLKRHLKGMKKQLSHMKVTPPGKRCSQKTPWKTQRYECRSLTTTNSYQGQPSWLKLDLINQTHHKLSYLYQQTLPKNKEIFPWILHELDTLPRRSSRPYNIKEPIIIPQEANEQLPDPKENTMEEINTDISSEMDHILDQEFEISTSLSELDLMLRQLDSEDVPLPNTEAEETNAWTVLDTLGTIAMDDF